MTTVVLLSTLVDDISGTLDLPKTKVKEVLDTFVELTGKHLKKGCTVRVNNLGSFQRSSRPARMGRNPKDGTPMKLKASKSVRFKVAAPLKAAM